MTHNERIEYAKATSRCFACKHYTGTFKQLSGRCLTGGLDPERVAAISPVLTASQDMALQAWSTVGWSNGCDRFEGAEA